MNEEPEEPLDEAEDQDEGPDDEPAPVPWYIVEKTVYVLEKGLLLIGSRQTPPEFSVEVQDKLEIVRPNGSRTRTRVLDLYESTERSGGDLLVEGMRPSDVPPGSKARVMQGKRRREA